MTLQHLRSSTANKRPDPTAMADGQIALNTAAASPGLFYKDSAGNLVKAGPVHVGSTAPNVSPASGGTAGNSTGESWLDTSGSNPLLKVWNGTSWQTVQPVASGTVVSTADTGSVTSTMIANGTIVDADVNASAAIAGTKVSPDFGSQNVTTTGTITGASLIPTSSTAPTNGVYLPAANSVAISTGGSGRLFVDASGNLLVGTSSSGSQSGTFGQSLRGNNPGLTFIGTEASGAIRTIYESAGNLIFWNGTGGTEIARFDSSGRLGIGSNSPLSTLECRGQFSISNNATSYWVLDRDDSDGRLKLLDSSTSSNERLAVDASGRLLVGTSTNAGNAKLQVIGDSAASTNPGSVRVGTAYTAGVFTGPTELGRVEFGPVDNVVAASISSWYDVTGTGSLTDFPGRLVFSTCPDSGSSPVERMRIGNDGTTYFGVTGAPSGSIGGSAFLAESDSRRTLYMASTTTGGTTLQVFRNPNGQIGSITTSGSATAFNTSSDYRLKENVVPVNDGITRLQQLKPSRFNFIVEPGKTVDGFIAHEVQAVVPEAIHGTKDAVDADGNPIYQGIDQSKLVPLLTAALQEAVAKIESLEARLTAAGI